MHLIIGGYYQGKLEYAKEQFSLNENDIFQFDEDMICNTEMPVCFKRPCLYAVEEFVKCCVKQKLDPVQILKEYKKEWQDSVMICTDIFCGVVQIDPFMRAWREQTGHVCAYLASEAESVTRMFCGLPQKLK